MRVSLSDERSAVLVMRVWLEDGSAFRARLTSPRPTVDGGTVEDVTVAVASSPGEVQDAIGEWLDRFISGAQ